MSGNLQDLESISPEEAKEMYLADRVDLRERTRQTQDYRLRQLLKWLDKERIDDLSELTGRDLARFRMYRSEEKGIAPATLRGNAFTYKHFLEFCESIEAVPEGIASKVRIPSLNEDQLAREHDLDPRRVEEILEYVGRFEYASRDHVILTLILHTGCRIGGLRAIDLRDYHPDPEEGPAYIEFVHRPPSTPLKNGQDGERWVALKPNVVEIIEDYRTENRRSVTDDDGRSPLVTTAQGRISTSAIRGMVYRVTSPCYYAECPHDRTPETCEATEAGRRSKCPSSRNPHDIRSAAIMRMKRRKIPDSAIEERVNATQEVIETHYDERTREEIYQTQMEQRSEHVDKL